MHGSHHDRLLVLGWILALILTALPVSAGAFEDEVRSRWRGAWILTEIETYSTCAGNYFNNDVSGNFVAARGGRAFEPGELAKVEKVQVNRKKVELMIAVAGRTLVPRAEGPFTLYDPRPCKMELEVAIPRKVIQAKDTESVDRYLADIAQRFSIRDDALDSSSWNGREADDYPADYDQTLAHHAVWSAEQVNRTIDEQMDTALLNANELAREVDGNPQYLAGFAEGARTMREWRERDCGRLIGSNALKFRHKTPAEFTDNTTWTAGFHDGQALVYHLAILTRLRDCYVPVPAVSEKYLETSITRH